LHPELNLFDRIAARMVFMRCRIRHSLPWLALATHAFAFVLVPGLHFWQISRDFVPTSTSQCQDCHATCGSRQSAPDGSKEESDSEAPSHQHDSKHCTICKFFLHAKSLPVATHGGIHRVACEEFITSEPELVFHGAQQAYLSRGPPLI
jgi:hypothetical protein